MILHVLLPYRISDFEGILPYIFEVSKCQKLTLTSYRNVVIFLLKLLYLSKNENYFWNLYMWKNRAVQNRGPIFKQYQPEVVIK